MSDVVKINSPGKKVSLKLSGSYEFVQDKPDPAVSEQSRMEEYHKRGFSEGYAKAKEELENCYHTKFIEKSDDLNYLLQSIHRKLSDYDRIFESAITDLSFAIAERVIRREIEKESCVEAVIKDSISKVLGANGILIKLNPADIIVISENETLKNLIQNSVSKIKIEEDERLEKGGCIIETEIGNADARITSQLAELKHAVEQLTLTNTNEPD